MPDVSVGAQWSGKRVSGAPQTMQSRRSGIGLAAQTESAIDRLQNIWVDTRHRLCAERPWAVGHARLCGWRWLGGTGRPPTRPSPRVKRATWINGPRKGQGQRTQNPVSKARENGCCLSANTGAGQGYADGAGRIISGSCVWRTGRGRGRLIRYNSHMWLQHWGGVS